MLNDPEPPARDDHGAVTEPARWRTFGPRGGDIAVVRPRKSGTTWTLGIVVLPIAGGAGGSAPFLDASPWIDINASDPGEVTAPLLQACGLVGTALPPLAHAPRVAGPGAARMAGKERR